MTKQTADKPAMKPITVGDPESRSTDLVAENIARLKSLFPEIITEGPDGAAINEDVLKQLVGDKTVMDAEEKYGLNWHGKRKARQLALNPSTGTLRPCPEESVDWDTTQNLFIEGDNLEVLKLLQKSYANKVKLIYIDPPYNKDADVVYRDDFSDNLRNYQMLTGQIEADGRKLTSARESSGRHHTNWLNMMLPRLKTARNLLLDSGVIFVSISEVELANLRKLCDEVFGEENFIDIFCWQKTTTPANLSNRTKKSMEYIVAYQKADCGRLTGLSKTSKSTNGLMNQPNPVGTLNFPPNQVLTGLTDGTYEAGSYGTSAYDIELLQDTRVKDGVFVEPVVLRGRFKWAQDYLDQQIADGVTIHIRTRTFSPSYERSEYEPEKPWNLIEKSFGVGTNENASAELDALFESNFSDNLYPKPVSLLRYLIKLCTGDGDIVMDFFAGSCTTAHAVLSLSCDAQESRRFIMVQLPEQVDESYNAFKAGFRIISDIGKERIRRAGKALLEAHPLFKGDTGFRVFKLDTSNIRPWSPNPADIEGTLYEHTEHLDPARSESDVLYELLLKLGLDLAVPIESRQIAHKNVHSVGAGTLFACLAAEISRDAVEALAQGIIDWHRELAPEGETTLVFRDSGFVDDVAKSNLTAILVQAGFDENRIRSL